MIAVLFKSGVAFFKGFSTDVGFSEAVASG
jgi:hypothetical protein